MAPISLGRNGTEFAVVHLNLSIRTVTGRKEIQHLYERSRDVRFRVVHFWFLSYHPVFKSRKNRARI